MTKESAKHRVHSKKSTATSNADFDTFLKNQQIIATRLKTELRSVINKTHLLDNVTVEKDNCILELQQSLNQREAEIHKLSTTLEQLKDENSRILMEFNFFKEKFYQLETSYDKTLNQQYQENENLRLQLEQQRTTENQEIQQLVFKVQDLQQKLQDNLNDFSQLNKLHVEIVQNFEQMRTNFELQTKEFELYKKQVMEDKKLVEETRQLELASLRDELKLKDESLKQCLADKNVLEKEKNLIIDELNNKIVRIERAFNQPTKVVQPLSTLTQQNNNSDGSESSHENVAMSLTQLCKPLEKQPLQSLSLIENQKIEPNQNQRNYKFKRPVLPPTSSPQSNLPANITNQRKRRNQPRQSTTKKSYNEFSCSSSDEENDNDSNYSNFSHQLWRPNNRECYIADTDASEGFAKVKRSKK